jgi:hypothetical protein
VFQREMSTGHFKPYFDAKSIEAPARATVVLDLKRMANAGRVLKCDLNC